MAGQAAMIVAYRKYRGLGCSRRLAWRAAFIEWGFFV